MSLSTFKRHKERTIVAALIVASAAVSLTLFVCVVRLVVRALH